MRVGARGAALSALLFCWIAGFGMADGALAAPSNEDWPSWRRDGSGVASGGVTPLVWGREQNVVWRTELPGEGHSSPIVSGDRVYVTTATPGTSNHPVFLLANVGAWLLCAFVLYRIAGGALRDPLRGPRGSAAYRILSVLLFLALSIAAARIAPEGGLVVTMAVGAVGSLLLLVLGHLASRKTSQQGAAGSGSGLALWVGRLGDLAGLALVALFVAAVVLQLVWNRPHAYGGTWAESGEIVSIGLLAVVACLPRRSLARWGAIVVAGGSFALLASLSPPSASWVRHANFKLIAAFVCVGFAAYAFDSLLARAGARSASNRGLRLEPLALSLLAALFFVSSNFLSTRMVLLREVVGVDRTSGEIAWRTVVSARHGRPNLHEANSAAAPTPVTDGERVYAHFGGVGIFALDRDGEIVWQRSDSAPPPHWGSGSSPILHEGLLIMTYDVDERSFTEAIETETGRTRWIADRTAQIEVPEGKHHTLDAYSTPIVFEWAGRTELVTHAKTLLAAYDPMTGEQRWAHKSRGRQVIPSTIQWNDLLIVGGAESQKYLAAIRVSAEGEQEIVWEAKRYQPELSSPVIYDDLLYTVTDAGVAACRDPRTGEVLWRERLPGEYYASLVAAAGKIYFTNLDGVTSVVEAGRSFRLVQRNSIEESINATPAVAGGDLYLRGGRHLFRIRGEDAPRVAEDRAPGAPAG